MTDRRLVFILLVCITSVGACRKAEVQSYRVPKETTAQATPATAPANAGNAAPTTAPTGSPGGKMANTPVATASGPGLTWTAPTHWAAKPAGAMRKGSYTVKASGIEGEADLSITAFPGDVGGELANLNRWRGQVKLAPVSQADAESNVQRVEHNGLKMTVTDLVGTGPSGAPERIVGAMVPHGGSTWFFKMQGPDVLVAKEKPAFMTMLQSVKPAAAQ
jgi:hypothetical protein